MDTEMHRTAKAVMQGSWEVMAQATNSWRELFTLSEKASVTQFPSGTLNIYRRVDFPESYLGATLLTKRATMSK